MGVGLGHALAGDVEISRTSIDMDIYIYIYIHMSINIDLNGLRITALTSETTKTDILRL